ncbi:MAG: fibronectin type III domain-containing protein [Bacteroidetes bacterium]|nr:MAG: fibronectin type III domain-containing protein [Bacteroidota bacterium]
MKYARKKGTMINFTRSFATGLMCIGSSLIVHAQSSCYQNPSLEGPSQAHVVPAPWQACYGSPDTQPGQWGITLPPSNGNSYVSFLHSGWANNAYNEGMTQLLTPCMVAGQTYTFTVDLAHTNVYTTADPNGCYSSLAVYGGNTACAQTETLWLSGVIMNTNWQQYTITFTPTGNWCYLSFSPYFINPCGSTGFDYINCMMDNISCISPASGAATGQDVTCNGACDGMAWATPTAGTPPYTFSWAPGGSTNDTITNICPGNYTVTITDANGQTAVDSVTIVEPTAIVLQTTSTDVSCNGGNNGTGGVTANGGTPPYTYSWAPGGQTTSGITGLTAGQYVATVTDANNCTVTATINITEPTPLSAPIAGTDATCYQQCNGSATVTPAGGTAPYSFNWLPSGGNAATASNLCAGNYSCDITDANGCTTQATVTITEPTQVTLNVAGLDATCNGACDGQLIVIPAGGTPAYNYAWSNGCNVANCTNVCAGAYNLTVSDANGCTATGNATVNEPAALLTATNFVTSYCGQSNGSATTAPNGGTPPYTYLWPSGGTNATENNLPPGNVCVQITDANGCVLNDCVTIPTTPGVTITNAQTNVACFGGSTGDATITTTSGQAPFTYLWTPNGQTTASINGLIAGQYAVTVTDANNCTATATITITEPPLLTLTPGAAQTICNGQQATITANAGGGVGPYNYLWVPGNLPGTSLTVQPAISVTYTVAVSDANNCTAVDSVLVTVNPLPAPALGSNTQSGCEPLDVSFTDQSFVSAGTITGWLWDFGDGSPTSNAQNPAHQYSASGTYNVTLTVTTAAGCTQTLTMPNYITVFASPSASFTLGPQPTTVLNATISFTDNSLLASQWQWDFGDPLDVNNTSTLQHPTHAYGDTGSYCVRLMVTSPNGCVDSTINCLEIEPEFTFFIPNAFTPNADGTNDVFYGYGTFITEYDLWIFDRWGNMIFHTDDLYKGWDGKVQGKSAEICQEDVYVWKVVLKDVQGRKHKYIGHVSLVK